MIKIKTNTPGILFSVLLFCALLSVNAQTVSKDSLQRSILYEGLVLYNLELASWSATGILLEGYNRDFIAGHISYKENDIYKTVFYRYTDSVPIAQYSFDHVMPITTANTKISNEERAFSQHEQFLYDIRIKTILEIESDTVFFKFYPELMFNIAMVELPGKINVYAFNRSSSTGFIPLGNDYLLQFDLLGNLVSRKMLHKELILVPQKADIKEDDFRGTMHRHGAGDDPYITPTDISTLLHYLERIDWFDHRVESASGTCIFNLKTRQLEIK